MRILPHVLSTYASSSFTMLTARTPHCYPLYPHPMAWSARCRGQSSPGRSPPHLHVPTPPAGTPPGLAGPVPSMPMQGHGASSSRCRSPRTMAGPSQSSTVSGWSRWLVGVVQICVVSPACGGCLYRHALTRITPSPSPSPTHRHLLFACEHHGSGDHRLAALQRPPRRVRRPHRSTVLEQPKL